MLSFVKRKMLRKEKLKKNNGIMVSDAIIAILILLISASIIVTLITSIAVEKTKIKQNSMNINILTGILEHIETIDYENVTVENLITHINTLNPTYVSAGENIANLTTPCKIQVEVEKYGGDDTLDLIKIVKLKIDTQFGKYQNTMEISRIKKATAEEVEKILET